MSTGNNTRLMLAMRFIGVGFFIVGGIMMGTLFGFWLDGKFNTRPILTLIGLFCGLGVAAFGVYQMLLPLLKDQNGEDR